MSKDGWQFRVLADVQSAVESHAPNSSCISTGKTVHLAVFTEPYLSYLLDGLKTVESRFSVNRCAPYQQVKTGDVLLIKRAGGPVEAMCEVGAVWFYELQDDAWTIIREKFTKALCADDPSFWTDRSEAAYATLLTVKKLRKIDPVRCEKRDRRGWVVLPNTKTDMLFNQTK